MPPTMPASTVNRKKNQYSDRRARPVKSTYLRKQILTASWKDIKEPPWLRRLLGTTDVRATPDKTDEHLGYLHVGVHLSQAELARSRLEKSASTGPPTPGEREIRLARMVHD